MINFNENNWQIQVPSDSFAETSPMHPDTNLQWVKFHDGRFGIGLNEQVAKKVRFDSSHKFIFCAQDTIDEKHVFTSFCCNEEALLPVFDQLCRDIVSFCIEHDEIIDESQAIIDRALAWEVLFNKGKRGLGRKQTLGLFAELEFLKTILNAGKANIQSWIGPTGASQDFDINGVFIECKNRTKQNTVEISSLEQIDPKLDLLIYSVEVVDDFDGLVLDELVEEIKESLPPLEQNLFENSLLKTGYLANKNYSEPLIAREPLFHNVDETFPHLKVGDVAGLIRAKYTLDLTYAKANLISKEDANERIYF